MLKYLPTIYIAAKFSSRKRLRPWRQKLLDVGYRVTSRWMVDDPDPSSEDDSLGDNLEHCQEMAERDQGDVSLADLFIIDTIDASQTGGREVELGYAMNMGIVTIRVGAIRNVFHAITDEAFLNWEACYQWLLTNYGLKEED